MAIKLSNNTKARINDISLQGYECYIGVLKGNNYQYRSIRYKLHPDGRVSDIPEAISHDNGQVVIPILNVFKRKGKGKDKRIIGLSRDGYGYELFCSDFEGDVIGFKHFKDPFSKQKIENERARVIEERLTQLANERKT